MSIGLRFQFPESARELLLLHLVLDGDLLSLPGLLSELPDQLADLGFVLGAEFLQTRSTRL